jgi:pimeloyl-ACP methyl ester carboxylesterase
MSLLDRQSMSFFDIIPIYKIIEQDLKQISARINSVPVGPYLSLPYDWRLDLTSSSLVLDDFVTRVNKFVKSTGITKITFICHSMGGLLVRLLLEWKFAKGKEKAPPWLDNIQRVLFICTPHLGAPTALAKICGLEWTWLVVSPWDMRKFAADKNFPSTYQLLPSADRNILFDARAQKFIRYDDGSVIAALALTEKNIYKRNDLDGALSLKNKPSTVTYFFAYGTGHATDEGVILNGLTLAGARPWSEVSGDGTVPSWSIIEAAAKCGPPIQTKPFQGSHIGILVTNAFRQFLYSYFALEAPPLLVNRGAIGIAVSLNKHTYLPNETVDALLIPDEEAREISGSLTLSRVSANGRSSHVANLQDLEIRGGTTRYLASKLIAPQKPGLYRLDFGGIDASHRSSTELAGWFVVQDTGHLRP